jgi:hypothetical protein
MKHKKLILWLSGGLLFSVFAGLFLTRHIVGSAQSLELQVKSAKTSYKLGEVIGLSFTLVNNGGKELAVNDCFGTASGLLGVMVAKNGAPFLTYNHPNWGTADADCRSVLKPNAKLEATTRIFWNWKPKLEGLNKDVAKAAADNKILTDYVFPEPGVYQIKASYYISIGDQSAPTRIESEPLQIIIEEPLGEDAEVWKKIRDNGELGYFIQEGEFKTVKPEEREKLRQELVEISSQYPDSTLAKQIWRSLQWFDAKDAKRKSIQQKVKQPE